MKNLHLLPTDKPSRLKQNKITKKISLVNKGIDLTSYTPINIFITSDEEIKEEDWGYSEMDGIGIWNGPILINEGLPKKIILTTDTDLIADGVQAIDDEFLEWFVKNPSCEWVEVEKYFHEVGDAYDYEIIIPKEEPKQTLEEAAQIYARKQCDDMYDDIAPSGGSWGWETSTDFIAGAKWQQEQNKKLYSEEDMKQFGLYLGNNLKKLKGKTIDRIFKQFKHNDNT